MTVTVVICTRFRPSFLEKRLEEVQKFLPPPDQILVIDNTDGDSETENVARRFSARYAIEPIPGMKPAIRRAISERETDVMVILRDDLKPALGWITTFLPDLSDDESGESGEIQQTPLRPVVN